MQKEVSVTKVKSGFSKKYQKQRITVIFQEKDTGEKLLRTYNYTGKKSSPAKYQSQWFFKEILKEKDTAILRANYLSFIDALNREAVGRSFIVKTKAKDNGFIDIVDFIQVLPTKETKAKAA